LGARRRCVPWRADLYGSSRASANVPRRATFDLRRRDDCRPVVLPERIGGSRRQHRTPPATIPVMSETATLLDVRGLACRFCGLQAIHDLDFGVRGGEIKAIIGPNGAGETTLFNMISGVIAPSAGHILLFGEPIDRLPSFQRARLGLSRTFQNLQIFKDMTVLENVMVGRHAQSHCGTLQALLRTSRSLSEERAIRDRSIELLARLGLSERVDDPAATFTFAQTHLFELAPPLP